MYRISLKNHLFALQGAIIFTIIVFIGVFSIGINKGFKLDLYIYSSIFYLINISAVFFVHLQYYQINKHTSIYILPEKQILYKSNGSEMKISFSEIVNVEIHMVPSLYYGNRIQLLPFEQYHYAVLNTVNEKIVISSLVIKNPIEIFTNLGIKIIRIKQFFPNIDI